MSATTQKIFLQIGATRDGLDPYLDASKRRGLKAILVETPDYIQLRHKLGRRPFDVEFAVAQAYDPNQVFKTLGDIKDNVRLTLPGFERYCECAYSLAEILRVPPWRETIHPHFSPPDKWNQRRLLSEKASGVLQPAYDMMHCTSDLTEDFLNNLKYPVVVKPVNSGGGLAVFLVEDYSQLQAALAQIRQLTNYEGTSFEKVIFEEYIQGTEYSVQGISWGSKATILTVCNKLIVKQPTKDGHFFEFREAGHVAISGHLAAPEFWQLSQSCLNVFGYKEGPFQIDCIQNNSGTYFLEMGFRLSGNGLVNLVKKVTEIDWADQSFACYWGNQLPSSLLYPNPSKKPVVGQITAISPEELKIGEHLHSRGFPLEIEIFTSPKSLLNSLSFAGSISADLNRTVGALGRITASGASITEVKHLLQKCLNL